LTAFGSGVFAADTVIRVLSDRTPSHLDPLFEQYEQGAGVDIEAVFVDDGLLARLKARPTEADVVITSTADILERAQSDGLLTPLPESTSADIIPAFRHPENAYVISSYRARGFYVSRDRVAPGAISSYEQLTEPEWQGRVCIRSGYHRYNVSLFAQMAADRGIEWTREWLTALKANLARAPSGNDRAQVRAIYENVCDVSIGNSYYMPIMLGREDQRAWGEATRVVFPDQNARGSYVMTGGMALTTSDRVPDAAIELIEFMLSDYGQEFVANLIYEYPVIDGIELPERLKEVGADQPDRTETPFRANVVALSEIEAARSEITRLLDEIDFDNP
jgi:iron(III) transport system substrate-binding protein